MTEQPLVRRLKLMTIQLTRASGTGSAHSQ
jgi:hypothetical protein